MNDVLFAPLSNYRDGASKVTGISNKTISLIKAGLENAVLAPRKPWRDRMELSDFDKCEIFINCKFTHNKQDNKLYIIKNISLILGFEPLSLHYCSKRYNKRICAPYRLSHEAV